jgi:hypothetical protein
MIDMNGAISKNNAFAKLNNESLKNVDDNSLMTDDDSRGIEKSRKACKLSTAALRHFLDAAAVKSKFERGG